MADNAARQRLIRIERRVERAISDANKSIHIVNAELLEAERVQKVNVAALDAGLIAPGYVAYSDSSVQVAERPARILLAADDHVSEIHEAPVSLEKLAQLEALRNALAGHIEILRWIKEG